MRGSQVAKRSFACYWVPKRELGNKGRENRAVGRGQQKMRRPSGATRRDALTAWLLMLYSQAQGGIC